MNKVNKVEWTSDGAFSGGDVSDGYLKAVTFRIVFLNSSLNEQNKQNETRCSNMSEVHSAQY